MKNFLYNKRDLLLCLIIVIIGAGLIINRSMFLVNIKSKAPKKPVETEAVTVTPTKSAVSEDAVIEKPKEEEPAEDSTESDKDVTLKIKDNDSSDSVAKKLEKLGAIDSAKGFTKYMSKHKLEEKIWSGTFTIPAGSTYAEIAKIITGG